MSEDLASHSFVQGNGARRIVSGGGSAGHSYRVVSLSGSWCEVGNGPSAKRKTGPLAASSASILTIE
jgi:hypothetical protein